jgi:Flp pilus assembly protein TadG
MMLIRHDRDARGQTLVEFALIFPLLVGMLVGAFDLGRVVLANDLTANAAREAARFAIVHGGSQLTACPVGPHDSTDLTPPAASASCPYPSPSTESIKQVARDFASAGGQAVTVTVCYGSGDTSTAFNKRGTEVTVSVTATVSTVAARIIGIETFTVSSTSTMLVNN